MKKAMPTTLTTISGPLRGDPTVRIEADSRSELDAAITSYFRQYAPAGYGTRITGTWTAGGRHVATISRYSSCD